MKKTVFMLAAFLVLTFAGCSSKTADIEGIITGYVYVDSYTVPLIVIEGNDKTFYAALVGACAAINFDHYDKSLQEGILNGEITGIKVHIEEPEKGKTLEINGEKVIVWQSHQIQKLEQSLSG